MYIKWGKLLFRLLGFSFLSKEAGKVMYQIQEEFENRLTKWMLRSSLWVLLFLLFTLSCLFALLALGFYLNERLYSSYQGFLFVAVGCLSLTVVLWVIFKLIGSKNKRTE